MRLAQTTLLLSLVVLALLLASCSAAVFVAATSDGGDASGGGGAGASSSTALSLATPEPRAASESTKAVGQRILDTNAAIESAEVLFMDAIDAMVSDNVTEGIALLRRAALQGSPSAMNLLAVLHAHGVAVPMSEAKSVLYHHMAAAAGNVESAMSLSNRYEHGIGVSQSCNEAAKRARIGAAAAMAEFRVTIPERHISHRLDDIKATEMNHVVDDQLSLTVLRAEKGDTKAMLDVGRAHMHGLFGAKRDARFAFRYFHDAIKKGNMAGHGALGQLFAQSVSSLIAAKKGVVGTVKVTRSEDAQPTVAVAGVSSPSTPQIASASNSKEQEVVLPPSQADAGATEVHGDPSAPGEGNVIPPIVGTNDATTNDNSVDDDSSSSDAGNTAGSGSTMLNSIDQQIERHARQARDHFMQGAKSNDPVALNGLGYLWATGTLVEGIDGVIRVNPSGKGEPNFVKAAEFFDLSAKIGNPEGLYNVGVMHLHGRGVKKDIRAAFASFTKASQQGSVMARFQLGNLQLNGVADIVPQSCPAALEHFKAVANKGSWTARISRAREKYAAGEYTASFLEHLLLAEAGTSAARYNAALILRRHEHELMRSIFAVTPTTSPAVAAATVGTTSSSAKSDGSDDDASAATTQASTTPATPRPSTTPAPVETTLSAEEEDARRLYAINSVHYALILRAAKEGSSNSHVQLGDIFYYGTGVPKDETKAAEHYAIAATHHSGQASFNLGLMYMQGIGLKKDYNLAKRFFDKSLEDSPGSKWLVHAALVRMNFAWWLDHFLGISFSAGSTTPTVGGNDATTDAAAAKNGDSSPSQVFGQLFNDGPTEDAESNEERTWFQVCTRILDFVNPKFFGYHLEDLCLSALVFCTLWVLLLRHHAH